MNKAAAPSKEWVCCIEFTQLNLRNVHIGAQDESGEAPGCYGLEVTLDPQQAAKWGYFVEGKAWVFDSLRNAVSKEPICRKGVLARPHRWPPEVCGEVFIPITQEKYTPGEREFILFAADLRQFFSNHAENCYMIGNGFKLGDEIVGQWVCIEQTGFPDVEDKCVYGLLVPSSFVDHLQYETPEVLTGLPPLTVPRGLRLTKQH